VIGIGLNVNQTEFATNISNPTSFKLITDQDQQLDMITQKLSGYIEKYYLQLRNLHFNFLDKAYMVNLYRYHQTALYRRDDQEFRGEIVGVTKEGKLIIRVQWAAIEVWAQRGRVSLILSKSLMPLILPLTKI
jgi:BirA family biotin operon repressor/biotin-[acetyl-CoA-carboxylase] ligase